jgi:tetratricopeptide (TPR) repeat protein
LLIVPAFLTAKECWSAEEISLFVLSFGALGHHLPGMMRAYGDKALYQRFKTRFILAPLFLATVCLLFALTDMSGIQLVSYLWGVWHGLMQTYGFLRIYDAKAVPFSVTTARLDYAMCLAWFGAGVLLSPTRMGKLLHLFYKCGGPVLSGVTLENLKVVWAWGTSGVTLLFLIHFAWSWHRGRSPSRVKLLLMITSFGFWWYSNVTMSNMLVGVALFEVFHDVQYLSIVWIFNRRRVEKGPSVGKFTHFLFRRSGLLIGMYVGLVFAYGSLNFVAMGIPINSLKNALTGLLAASALLHFYYDGFIWKVREQSTRQSLGLKGGETGAVIPRPLPYWVPSGLRWSFFVMPVAWLGITEMRGVTPEIERARAIVAAAPGDALGHYNLGVALTEQSNTDEAISHFREAVRINPDYAMAHNNLGAALAGLGNNEEAITHYLEALRLKPDFAKAHNNLGVALASQGRIEDATAHFRQALEIKSFFISWIHADHAEAHYNLGVALASQGRVDEAVTHYLEALRIRPDDVNAHNNLGLVLFRQGKTDQAVSHFQEALRIKPSNTMAKHNLENALRYLER